MMDVCGKYVTELYKSALTDLNSEDEERLQQQIDLNLERVANSIKNSGVYWCVILDDYPHHKKME